MIFFVKKLLFQYLGTREIFLLLICVLSRNSGGYFGTKLVNLICAKRDLLVVGRDSSGWCQGQGKNEGEGQSQCRQPRLEPSGPQSSSFQSQVLVLRSIHSPLDRTTRKCQGLRIHSVHQPQAIEDELIQPEPDETELLAPSWLLPSSGPLSQC